MSESKLAVSVDEAAALIGVGRDIMFRLTASGEVKSFKIGARRLVSVKALHDFVERRTAEPVPAEA